MNSFSSSILGAIEITGSNLTVKGNLLVKGTTTQIDSTTINIGDNIIELNGTGTSNGGLVVRDGTGANIISGSLLWDTTLDYWKAGPLGSEERIILVNEYNTFSTSINSRANSIESTTSSLNSFTSSYNTGSFTGSFKGDGGLLYNIPASGVTGLNLMQIADGSVTASVSNANGLRVNSKTEITGSLIVTNGITGSIDYSNITNKPTLVSGSSQILLGSGVWSGSAQLPSGIVSGSSQIIYSGLTGIPSDIVSGSSQLTGSYDTRYVLSGSITQTTWDNIANKPNDIVSSSNQISAFGFLQTSSFNTYTSSNDGRVSSLESFTSSLNTNYVSETEFGTYTGSINTFTSSVNTYTSSNDGRVSSLESKTGSYATTGSNSFIGTERVTGSLIVSSSLNVIGTQNVTGSLIVSNSLNVIGTQTVTGSLIIANATIPATKQTLAVDTNGYLSFGNVVYNGTIGNSNGYVNLTQNFPIIGNVSTSGYMFSSATNAIAGTQDVGIRRNASGSVEIFNGLTGDGTLTNRRDLLLRNITGSNASFSGSLNVIGTQNVTGSLIVSNSLKVIGNENINGNLSVTGSLVISGSLDLSNANIDNSRYLHTQGAASTTWTIVHNLNYLYPNITVYDASNKVMLPAEITSIDVNTTQLTFAVAESGHALASVGGISTSSADRFLHTQASATGSWIIDHNIGYKYVTVNVYDGNDEQLVPLKITAVSINRTQIDFSLPTTGNAIITVGGARSTSMFNLTGSYYNTTSNIGITGSLVVTGDVDGNSFNTTSDKKLKTNLVRIEGALDKIEKLNGYTFDWLEEYSEDRSRQIGMVADEVYEVQPELISHRDIVLSNKEEKIKLLDYSKVTALLLEAIKELNDKVTKLENKKKKK